MPWLQMEKQRSPLLKELLTYLRELMKDYKTEVKGTMCIRLMDASLFNVHQADGCFFIQCSPGWWMLLYSIALTLRWHSSLGCNWKIGTYSEPSEIRKIKISRILKSQNTYCNALYIDSAVILVSVFLCSTMTKTSVPNTMSKSKM